VRDRKETEKNRDNGENTKGKTGRHKIERRRERKGDETEEIQASKTGSNSTAWAQPRCNHRKI
jgi:hypothetical protein